MERAVFAAVAALVLLEIPTVGMRSEVHPTKGSLDRQEIRTTYPAAWRHPSAAQGPTLHIARAVDVHAGSEWPTAPTLAVCDCPHSPTHARDPPYLHVTKR